MKLPTLNRYPVTCKDKIILIPLFYDPPRRRNRIGKAGYRGYFPLAAWSWYSWHENSDAREEGVRCAIYLEDKLASEARPYFEKCGLDWNNDVILFESEPQESYGRFMKCIQPVWDARFSEHDQVIISDADMFVPVTEVNVLDKFGNVDKDTSLFMRASVMQNGTCKTLRNWTFIKYFAYDGGCHDKDPVTALQEALDVHREITGREFDINFFLSEDSHILHTMTNLMLVPTGFLQQQADIQEWIRRVGKVYGNDETFFVLLYHLFGVLVKGMSEYNLRHAPAKRIKSAPTSKKSYLITTKNVDLLIKHNWI